MADRPGDLGIIEGAAGDSLKTARFGYVTSTAKDIF